MWHEVTSQPKHWIIIKPNDRLLWLNCRSTTQKTLKYSVGNPHNGTVTGSSVNITGFSLNIKI